MSEQPASQVMDDSASWPRVTRILRGAGLVDTRWFTPESRERGRAVHLACQYLDDGDLDRASVTEEIRPYLAAYEGFCEDIIWRQWAAIESPVKHSVLRYRGTPDRVSDAGAVYEIKTGAPAPWHALQLAAYAACLSGHVERWAVYLQADGKYKVVPYQSRTDWRAFQAALTIYNWKLTHGAFSHG